jgi:hypothetical protein
VASITVTQPATIKLFLLYGDPKRLRTAEIINWTGKALAAPRTEFQELLNRDEMVGSGVYILTGADPDTGQPQAYIGEAEILRERLPFHKGKDFWSQIIAFVSKDENLTKAHIRYLEGRLIQDARQVGRLDLTNSQPSGSKLPESDREDMEGFLSKIHQLLPVMGSELVTPVVTFPALLKKSTGNLICEIKGLVARGQRTSTGFVIFSGSQAVSEVRLSAPKRSPYVVATRQTMLNNGSLVSDEGFLRFTQDVEFTSPSAAAAIIHGGSANGLEAWRDEAGRALKYIETENSTITN